MLHSDIQFFIVEEKIEAQIWIFLFLSLDFFLHFLTFCLIGDDWNPVMEH